MTSAGILPGYDPQAIEADRQAAWRGRDAFKTPAADSERPRRYIKPSAPFTSGNIHIGHVRSYSIGDAYARFWRARGEDVLFAFGFDSFGLPAELGAIAGGVSPSEWVARCAEHMTGQLKRLGFSFDWERAFMSSDALMYRWSQWLFLTLLEAGLIYRGTGTVDWCDTCQTTLATIQVENGECWRCHNPVRLIQRPQWYLKISEYVRENDERLAELQRGGIWDENALASQRFVIGRVDGVELDLREQSENGSERADVEGQHGGEGPGGGEGSQDGSALTVFTPHADAIGLAQFVAISPRHPQVEQWAAADGELGERLEELRAGGLERAARDAETMPLVDTGRAFSSPTGGDALPAIVTPTVDGRYGATAVLGIPERDRTDAVIAQRLFGWQPDEQDADSGEGASVHTRAGVRYKANDFTISRQRSWGTPIPIVYCERCGTVPLRKEQLPVLLPLDLRPTGEGNPLAEREDFVNVACPSCGGAAKRETDTLDCHFDALWLWVPVCVPPGERERTLEEILALEDLRAWLPSERVVAGSDSGNFVFDQRTVTKALRDIGPLAFLADGEPFAGCLFHEMVIAEGRKMSKHLGNVVDPDELVAEHGADTVRLAVLYAAAPQRSLNWSDSAVQRCRRFLRQLWDFTHSRLAEAEAAAAGTPNGGVKADPGTPGTADGVAATNGAGDQAMGPDKTEHLRRRLEQWCETAVEKITEDLVELQTHTAVRNAMRLFDRIKDYEKRVLAKRGSLCEQDRESLLAALALLARVLVPFAPHIAEQLLLALGPEGEQEIDSAWPAKQLVSR